MDLLFPGIKNIAAANGCIAEYDFVWHDYLFKKENKVHKKRLSCERIYALAKEGSYAEITKEVLEICKQLNEA